MSNPSRNDPCPCGSGKKYKACHQRVDQETAHASRILGPDAGATADWNAAEEARTAPFWEADVVPIMERFRDSGEAGSLALVVAGGLILTGEVRTRRPAGAAARAGAVLDAVLAGARKCGSIPERLHVRDPALAEALRPELQARGIVAVAAPLPVLDDAVDGALEHMAGSAQQGAVSSPWTWAETEASRDQLAEFFAAAAAFYRAAPWRTLQNGDALLLAFPGEEESWAASVMGGGGFHTGLALYSDPADLDGMLSVPGMASSGLVQSLRGITMSLSYDPPAGVSRAMRREVAAAGWELAGNDAYPALLGVRIPGRRITAELVRRTAAACRAVVAFVQERPEVLPWRDPGSGVQVALMYEIPEAESRR